MVAQKRTETCMTVLAEARLAAAVGKSSERRLGMKASLWHWNENTTVLQRVAKAAPADGGREHP